MGKITLNCTDILLICWHRASSLYTIPSECQSGSGIPIRIFHVCSQIDLPKFFLILCLLLWPLLWVLRYIQCLPQNSKSPWVLTLSWSRGMLCSHTLLLVLCFIKYKCVQRCSYLSFHKAPQKTSPSAFCYRHFSMALRPGPWGQAWF